MTWRLALSALLLGTLAGVLLSEGMGRAPGMPLTIDIHGQSWRIIQAKLDPANYAGDAERSGKVIAGYTLCRAHLIAVNQSLSEARKRENLMHEAMHAMSNCQDEWYAGTDGHAVIYRTAQAEWQLMQDNPDFARYISAH